VEGSLLLLYFVVWQCSLDEVITFDGYRFSASFLGVLDQIAILYLISCTCIETSLYIMASVSLPGQLKEDLHMSK